MWLGASIKHLNKPNISFVENGNVPLDIFYSLHANYKFPYLLTSINAFVGLEFEQLRFGFSYDINTTDIGRTDGVYELSITYLAGCLICKNPANLERRK